MKKKIIILIFSLTILFNIYNNIFAIIDNSKIESKNIGVYNLDNMELLYGINQNEKISIASITKVMTAIVAIENIDDLNEIITIDYSTINGKLDPDLVVAGIYEGEKLSYYDLLCTMLIPSGADSAMYLANNILDNEETFIQKMNEKAKELKLNNTNFSNPTGLDDENNYSTINDVSKIMKYALSNNTLKEIMSLEKYTTSDKNITVTNTISKTSKRYGLELEYIIGGKTGTTSDAGLCLASFSKDEDTNLLAIVTGSSMYSKKPYNIIDTEYIYSEIINDYSKKAIISQGDIIYTLPSVCTKQENVSVCSKEDIFSYTDNVNKQNILVQYEGLETLDYTIKQGEKIGTIKVYYNNIFVKELDITLDEKLNFSITKWIRINKKPIIIFSAVIFIMIILLKLILKKRKNK